MRPTLCCWNFTPARLGALRGLCGELGIALRAVGAGDVRLPLARLPETEPAASIAAMPFADEMLLMAAFPGPLTDALLAGLRRTGLAPVPLKAVLTLFNMGWDSVRLHRELSAEAARLGDR